MSGSGLMFASISLLHTSASKSAVVSNLSIYYCIVLILSHFSHPRNEHVIKKIRVIWWKDHYHRRLQDKCCKHHHKHPKFHPPQKQQPKSNVPQTCHYLQSQEIPTKTTTSKKSPKSEHN
ncbi:hypothetical protein AAHE18_19G157900 [Arachis hypogaea]